MPRLVPAIPAAMLACVLACALPARADAIYKWVDDKGVTHFSQTPPDKLDSKRLDVRTAPADTPATDAKAKAAEAKAAEAKDADAKPQRTEAQKKERAERCKQAQDDLARLEDPKPLVRFGEKGEAIPMADDERPALIEQVKKVIGEQCGD